MFVPFSAFEIGFDFQNDNDTLGPKFFPLVSFKTEFDLLQNKK